MKRVIIIDDPNVDKHIPISRLPETPERTLYVRQALRNTFLNDSVVGWCVPTPLEFSKVCELMTLVHSEDYIKHLVGTLEIAEAEKKNFSVSSDTEALVSEGSREALCSTLSSICHAVDLACADDNDVKKFFCNVRPPSHHCCRDKAMGFCLINNVAIAVTRALNLLNESEIEGKCNKKIAIIDWDFHCGNGTEEIFYDNKNVLYISLHGTYQMYFPNSGKPEETGLHNNVLNINLYPNTGHNQIINVFQEQVMPKLTDFGADMIFISCGFDGHYLDPIGDFQYTDETYSYMTKCLVEYADKYCKGRIISVLEGGYNITALQESSIAHVKALSKCD